MDEQAKKINEARDRLFAAVAAFDGEPVKWLRQNDPLRDEVVEAATHLLNAWPVEGWPEQLPTMRACDAAGAARAGAVLSVRAGSCGSSRATWMPAPDRFWDAIAGYGFEIIARVVEPPKPSTERVPWWEAVGRKIGGRPVREVCVSDLHDPWCSFTEPGAGDDTDDDSTGLWADADGMVEVEVLDTETGAPE